MQETRARAAAILALFGAIGTFAASPSLPDPRLTPGATLSVPLKTLCTTGKSRGSQTYAHAARHVTAREKSAVFAEYGISPRLHRSYEVDHLIPLELGGSNSIANLWPQPRSGEWNAQVKDALEDRLHKLVCEDAIPLDDAQQGMRTDWIALYKRIFGTR